MNFFKNHPEFITKLYQAVVNGNDVKLVMGGKNYPNKTIVKKINTRHELNYQTGKRLIRNTKGDEGTSITYRKLL